jgi:hypothetical protein
MFPPGWEGGWRDTLEECVPYPIAYCIWYRTSATVGPTECHRTTRANIRSRLDGGPQGRNPHFFGSQCSPLRVINPSKLPRDPGRGQTTTPRRVLHPNALVHIRASDRGRRLEEAPSIVSRTSSECAPTYKGVGLRVSSPGGGRPAFLRIPFEQRHTDKAVEPSPLRHAFSWEQRTMGGL